MQDQIDCVVGGWAKRWAKPGPKRPAGSVGNGVPIGGFRNGDASLMYLSIVWSDSDRGDSFSLA